MKTLLAFALLLLALSEGPPGRVEGAPQQKEIKALFLGDRGHHKPAERARQLIPVLAERGIAITYTEDAKDINAQKLAGFDALLLYANLDTIKPEQEKALLDF